PSTPENANRNAPPVKWELPPRSSNGAASSIATRAPLSCAEIAAHNAALPAPTTRTSGSSNGKAAEFMTYSHRRLIGPAWGQLDSRVRTVYCSKFGGAILSSRARRPARQSGPHPEERRIFAARLEGWPLAPPCPLPSFETRARARSSG